MSLVLAGPLAQAAGHAIFKCTLPDGKTTFSDTPCADTSSQQQLRGDTGTAKAAMRTEDKPQSAAAATQPAHAADAGNCSAWTPPDGDVVVEQPRKIDPGQLPHDASGRPVEIFVSKRSAMTAAAACSAMVSACSHKSADPSKSIDACFKSAPRCASEHPWEEEQACCPQACWQKYTDLRRQCVDASRASYQALFEEHCVPGTTELRLERESP